MSQAASPRQYRALTIATILVVIFAIYFVRPFFSAIVLAAITAYLFSPTFNMFSRHIKKPSTASSLTLLVAMLTMLVPLILILIFTVLQIDHLLKVLDSPSSNPSLTDLGQSILTWVNNLITHIPGAQPITNEQLNEAVKHVIEAVAGALVGLIAASASSISNFITALFIYMYVFLNLLTHREYLIDMVRRLNPLGPKMTDRYLERVGSMTGAMARGQFIIAVCQGFVETIIVQLAGIHGLFFFFFVLFSFLSLIPLGGGIVVIPMGIIMILVGNVWQGLFVLAGHFLVVTNIDNILRPRLVPKNIRLNPALTLLSVFSGVAMFGFLGIIIGPVLMIVIKLTIEAYLDTTSPKKPATP